MSSYLLSLIGSFKINLNCLGWNHKWSWPQKSRCMRGRNVNKWTLMQMYSRHRMLTIRCKQFMEKRGSIMCLTNSRNLIWKCSTLKRLTLAAITYLKWLIHLFLNLSMCSKTSKFYCKTKEIVLKGMTSKLWDWI